MYTAKWPATYTKPPREVLTPPWREAIPPSLAPKGRAFEPPHPRALWREGILPSLAPKGRAFEPPYPRTFWREGILPSLAPKGRAFEPPYPRTLWREGILPSLAPKGRAFTLATLLALAGGTHAQQVIDDPIPERIEKGNIVLAAVPLVRAPRTTDPVRPAATNNAYAPGSGVAASPRQQRPARVQRHPRRPLHHRHRWPPAPRLSRPPRRERQFQQRRLPQRSRLHGLRLPPGVRAARPARLRQALHCLQRNAGKRRCRLSRSLEQRAGKRAARMDGEASRRRNLRRHLTRPAPGRPVRRQPQRRGTGLQPHRQQGRCRLRLALHRLRRRRQRARPARLRPRLGGAVGRHPPHRSARWRRRRKLRSSRRQPARDNGGRGTGGLGMGLAPPAAVLVGHL